MAVITPPEGVKYILRCARLASMPFEEHENCTRIAAELVKQLEAAEKEESNPKKSKK
jgi:hypothetical protein